MIDPEECLHEYTKDRYLRNMDDITLQERNNDIAYNLWSTDSSGTPIQTLDPNHRHQLLKLLMHVMLEQASRNKNVHIDFNEQSIRETATASYKAPKLKTPLSLKQNFFAKFGKYQHIKNTLEKGFFRITPASFYSDTSLNSAQNDQELEHEAITPNEQIPTQLYGLNDEGKEAKLPRIPKEFFKYNIIPDFYVWCCTIRYDARFFHDFEADTALIISDKVAFQKRLKNAVFQKQPELISEEDILKYYDPYTSPVEHFIPYFSKHFRYLYQNEYRFTWRSVNQEPLKPFFVELGKLNDIATLIELA